MKSNNIWVLLSFLFSTSFSFAQITLHNVSSISILDKVNINYESVKYYGFEIRFEEKIELWVKNKIPQKAFQEQYNAAKFDSLLALIKDHNKDVFGNDSLRKNIRSMRIALYHDYEHYLDTIAWGFVQTLDSNKVINLLAALQAPFVEKDTFLAQNALDPSFDYIFGRVWTSYYPMVGMTVISTEGDTLIAYCNSQGDLTLPWTIRGIENFNPNINRALHAILPEEMSYNRDRLVNGLE